MTGIDPVFRQTPLAHRGYHDVQNGLPENSMAAFRAAIDAGYGIELDVQLSQDERAMVFHDNELDRLTAQSGQVRARRADELGAIPLIGGNEGMPTLRQVLDLVAGRVPLLIEIKDQDGSMGPNVGPLEEDVANALVGYDGSVAVMSFNPHAVAAFAANAPDIARGLVTSSYDPADWPELTPERCEALRPIADYDRLGASFISHEVTDLNSARVADLQAGGATVLCWTVRSEIEEAVARRVAHNITFEGYAAPHPDA